ncbi:type III secretion system export apparatus subunit SctU [Herbaspirillum sp. GCM10030257]|uniref:type III secretion system export apparatus subunit SctU n=1 Tax=Herbaspirillum sp. GCM10030257 TaxID=3273393 RepID=UPI00361AD2E1
MSEEKNEQPTDKKIEDARKKGQVPVSKDMARLASLLVVGELAFMTEPLWHEAINALFALPLPRIGQPFAPALMEMLVAAGILLLIVFATLFVVCIVVGVAAHWGQFGMLIAPEAVTPSFDKLNPVNGIKQLFSKKKLMELLLTIFKAVLIGWIVFILARDQLPNIVQLSTGAPKDVYSGFIALLRTIFHVILGVCLCLAIIDFAVQKHSHTKSLMMDMEEIKREHKESEGDPMIKGMRKQIARQLAMSGPVAKTEQANAVVVNPTHFAVAMFYDPDETIVPVVLAKGKDDVAQAMILRARECGIPVIRHVWLARTLYATCKDDTLVPRSSYEAVAHVYAVVNELHAADDVSRSVELESLGEPPDSFKT